jgi:hypothetical protein
LSEQSNSHSNGGTSIIGTPGLLRSRTLSQSNFRSQLRNYPRWKTWA